MLMLAVPALLFVVSTTSCNSKTSDADVKTAVDKAIAANAGPSTVSTSVNDGVVTLSGEVKDEATKTAAETAARGVNGVKSVTNNLSVTPPPATVVITADDPLKASVDNTIKAYPGVSASIQDGVVTLTGEIKRADLQKLMMDENLDTSPNIPARPQALIIAPTRELVIQIYTEARVYSANSVIQVRRIYGGTVINSQKNLIHVINYIEI